MKQIKQRHSVARPAQRHHSPALVEETFYQRVRQLSQAYFELRAELGLSFFSSDASRYSAYIDEVKAESRELFERFNPSPGPFHPEPERRK